ncbi:MAG: hypothetical protein AB1941_23100 [Gemmatimonadota bacterium]
MSRKVSVVRLSLKLAFTSAESAIPMHLRFPHRVHGVAVVQTATRRVFLPAGEATPAR